MSLPTAKHPTQSSIKSFFQKPKSQPQYAPPPSAPAAASSAPTTATPSAPPSAIPPQATIRLITEPDILPLRRINSILLPVSFPDTFYESALNNPHSRVITWSHDNETPKVIGAIVCNLEPATSNLYIRTLCLLSPYRSHGLMSAALDHIAADPNLGARSFTAHVWTQNEEGIAWYKNRGFSASAPIEGYYLKLRPNSAYLVTKHIQPNVPSAAPHTARAPPLPSATAAVVNLPQSGGTMTSRDRPLGPQWNDLPEDMMTPPLLAPPKRGSETNSNASSRSSSAARKKKDRYPAAAFANGA